MDQEDVKNLGNTMQTRALPMFGAPGVNKSLEELYFAMQNPGVFQFFHDHTMGKAYTDIMQSASKTINRATDLESDRKEV